VKSFKRRRRRRRRRAREERETENVLLPPPFLFYVKREREKRNGRRRNGDATRSRRTVQRVVPQKRQPIVLRLQHGEPKVDVEKFLRVHMPRLLGDPSIVRRAHHGGEKREHGSMDRGRAGFVQSERWERCGEGVFFAARMEFKRTR